MLHSFGLAPIVSLALLASCASSPGDRATSLPTAPITGRPVSADSLPDGWDAWLGLDPLADGAPMDWRDYFERYPHTSLGPSLWDAADGCLFELAHWTGRKVRRWLVLVRPDPEDLAPKFQSLAMNTDAGDGKPISMVSIHRTALVSVVPAGERGATARRCTLPCLSPGQGLRVGVDEACEAMALELSGGQPDERLSRGYVAAVSNGVLALQTLFSGVKSHSELGAILKDVVRTPSLWSVVRDLGVELTMHTDVSEHEAETIELEGWPDQEGASIPVTVYANGQVALELDVLAVDPRPPVHLVAGIVGLRARHPSDPDQLVELRLIGARKSRP